MGQEVANSVTVTEGSPDLEAPVCRKTLEYTYSRDILLSYADLETCKKLPDNLDPHVLRGAHTADSVEGGIAIPAASARGLVRRDRESELYSKSPQDIPEWRKDSWRAGGSGTSLQPSQRRKPFDEEPPGNAFSTSYPPRPAANWGDNVHLRNSYDRPGPTLQGQGSGRWEHRVGLGDREREKGRPVPNWEGDEPVPVPIVVPDGPRASFGGGSPVVRPGWMPAERDGLLGSGGSLHGGSLHRTYTGNFTTPPTALRGGPERHNSMGRINSRTNEPYLVSRSLKVVPTFTRREDTDFVNDETFGGSEEISNEERAEQERKRRESFELMRKENQRVLQHQQKLLTQKQEERLANPEAIAIRKHDENTLWDDSITGEVHSATSPRSPEKHSPTEMKDAIPAGGGPLSSVAPSTPRPAIPPGFAKVIQQMQTTPKAPATKETPMEGDSSEKDTSKQVPLQTESALLSKETVVADDPVKLDDKLVPVSHDSLGRQAGVHTSVPMAMTRAESMKIVTSANEAKEIETPRSVVSDSNEERGEGWSFKIDGLSDNKQGASGDDVKENIFVGVDEYNISQESLLDKWFGRTKPGQVSGKDGLLPSHPLADEPRNRLRRDESWTEGDSKMSKFAQWFHQEEKQQFREGAAASSDIMSLFPKGGSSKATPSLSKEQVVAEAPKRSHSVNYSRNHGRVLPMPTGPSLEDIEKGLTANANAAADHEQSVTKESILLSALSLKNLEVEHKGDQLTGIFGEHSPVGKFKFQPIPPPRASSSSKSSPVFLTCEDIEQSMLAEAGTNPEKTIPISARTSRVGHEANRKGEQGGQAADTLASRHLLSLLQKGAPERKYSKRGGLSRTESFGDKDVSDADDHSHGGDWTLTSNSQEAGGSSKTLQGENPTLEALFGKAFMSELRSVEAPVSSKTFAGDYYGNGDGTQAVSGAYLGRQSSGRMNNSASNSNNSKPWLGTIGPLSKMPWAESKMLEPNRLGHIPDLPGPRHKGNHYMVQDHDETRSSPSSGHGFWGNGVNTLMANGSPPLTTSGGLKGSFASSLESNSFALGDVVDNSPRGKGHLVTVPSSDLDIRSSTKGGGEGEIVTSGSFSSVQMRASEDTGPTSTQGKVIPGDEPSKGPSSSFDSSGLSKVFKDESLAKRMAGDIAGKFTMTEHGVTSREENTTISSQGLDSFLLASHKLDRKEISEELSNGDKLGIADEVNSGNDRKMTDALSEALGLTGKVKDGNARASTAGLSEQANAGSSLSRGSSFSNSRFKGNSAGVMQPVSGFASFPPNAPLQHQQSLGAVYRSDPPPALTLQPRQSSSIPVHHHLQQSPSSGALSMFPPQPFRPQPGLPQQQQLLAPSFSNGSSMEYPHIAFGHGPTPAPSRPIHFPPSPHGHLSPPGAYHPMGHMGPAHNHFMPAAQMPQRGPVMSPMTDAHVYMQEQSLHDPHGLGTKPGPPPGPALFPLGGHALHSPQGPMFHQPLGHNLRGQHNQLLQVQAPWVPPYGSEFMRTGSKGHESPNFVNGNGGAVGGGGTALDRWFGMDLPRNLSGIPTPGLIQLSPHGLEADSKMRFG
ncbi:hypothetical protein MPTK1_8g02270 [Marchantia polymorpha subsp. ruderalis]|uniref:Uncharacterized protein n=1 Tax=Marchantia polymorpha TaxID=3197 RepID=A0A2R6XJ02_MARPO|nr:hypothetical protein MARPO_0012s0024 [Marchantia polymorpha]BBN18414.1 hypothetical protein Mp_8g02270 [Marchantia polymorpha subsp. ruderalis]|eukprot:PTQ46061.1 hypothetical protein MARPO_0012s0024 [Marchantia polymorpha]